ncbi:hypothetical protein [Moraxella lacunata]
MLSTPFDDITVQGVHSTPLHPNIIVFVVILKFIGYIKITLKNRLGLY